MDFIKSMTSHAYHTNNKIQCSSQCKETKTRCRCTENYSNNQTSPTGWWLLSANDHEKRITKFEVIPSGIWGADVTKVKVGAAGLGPAVQRVTHFMSGQDPAHSCTWDKAQPAPVEPAPVEPAPESDGVTGEVTVLTREEMEAVKTLRANRKGAITKHLSALKRLIVERDAPLVTERLKKLKRAFLSFEEAHDEFHALLTEPAHVADSDQYFLMLNMSILRESRLRANGLVI